MARPKTHSRRSIFGCREGRPSRVVRAVFIAVLAPASVLDAQASSRTRLPAEEERLNIGVFRAGLKKRGLNEILDLHLDDFPPRNKIDAMLLTREVKLAEYADASRARAYRMRVLAEANDILGTLIEEHPDDKRRVDWQFALVRSLLYEQAEPILTRILYRGGTESDRAALRPQTGRALETANDLLDHLDAEYARIDNMTIAGFERLERTGYLDRLDELMPKAQYVRLWALFYDSLAYGEGDPDRAARLHQVLAGLQEMQQLLATPHDESHVQIQAMTLLGMTFTRLNQHRQAREVLKRALAVGERLSDTAESARVAWALRLARLEFIRNERAELRFDAALTASARFADSLPAGDAGFGMRLVVALEQREIHRAWARHATDRGEQASAEAHRRLTWQVLMRLTQQFPERRGEIYGMIGNRVDPDAARDQLDPFEQCAVLAELLSDGTKSGDELRRAIKLGDEYFQSATKESAALAGELLYHLAAAEYRLGNVYEAARRFLRLSRDFPDATSAQKAATLAVELTATLQGEPLPQAPKVDQLYGAALAHLLTRYSDSSDARYWRFFYARYLDRTGNYDEAAKQYAQVDQAHEHYVEGLFLEIRALAKAVEAAAEANALGEASAHRRIDTLFAKYRAFVTEASSGLRELSDRAAREHRRTLLARAKVNVGETLVLPGVARHAGALELMADFESGAGNQPELSARVWRVRLAAYQALGRLDEAARAIPAYLAAEPTNAGPTLQALFLGVADEVRRASFGAMDETVSEKARLLLLLARHIHEWATNPASRVPAAQRRAVKVQLAEANLWAGRYEQARDQFAALRGDGAGGQDQRIVFGYAEALFHLGRFEEALAEFNRLVGGLDPSDELRWKALLRDLQCRNALGHDPKGIIKVIEQQKFLYPELGGSELAGRFKRLLRENQRRQDGR